MRSLVLTMALQRDGFRPFAALRRRLENRKTLLALGHLDVAGLADIGLTPADVSYLATNHHLLDIVADMERLRFVNSRRVFSGRDADLTRNAAAPAVGHADGVCRNQQDCDELQQRVKFYTGDIGRKHVVNMVE